MQEKRKVRVKPHMPISVELLHKMSSPFTGIPVILHTFIVPRFFCWSQVAADDLGTQRTSTEEVISMSIHI